MRVGAVVRPLVSGATYRRGVHLLLGGVLLLPYVLVAVLFAGMFTVPDAPYGLLVLVLALVVVIGVVPPFLRGTRALEIVAARALLGVPLPDPPVTAESGREARETRVRAALWFAVHLVAGGVVALLILIPLVMGVTFVVQWFGIAGGALDGLRIGPLDEHDTGWLSLLGVVTLAGVLYAVAGLGALAAVMAPVLLGPSPAERIAALEARAARLAERNRLARELHDSIGHALTVTMLQASAALHLLDTDPEFARGALQAIEETGRAATEDLDRVLGMLRERDRADEPAGQRADGRAGQRADGRAGQRADERAGAGGGGAPPHGLGDLDRLVAHSRGTGVEVDTEIEGSVDDLPAPVSREGYRIIQESLTNVLRHAGPVPVALRVAVDGPTLTIEVSNPVTAARPRREGGRGLVGMRERVTLLGGTMTAGPDGAHWRVSVHLPALEGEAP
ncbi:sensor histidine kinase [Sphaerisporangium perillae]|uniref:sensor histidine kinase n=1 Tax=Sphaerisporangium perillae TaxID=2935860 RepID=UPI00200CDC27|nr:histidine kinase [Sphaerisporangium perillae]